MLLLLFDVLLCSQFYLTVMKRTIFLFIGASILLVGCSSTYGSREEASGAADEWAADSRLVVVEWQPTFAELQKAVQQAKQDAEEMSEEKCSFARRALNRAEYPERLTNAKFMEGYYCNRKSEIDESVVALGLVERTTKRTRWCDEEKETKQFVCKERDVDESIAATESTPMSGNDWKDTKTTYSYFRY